MRVIFGVLSLLVVLAIVGSLAKKQLQSLGMTGASTRESTAASQAGIALPPPGSRDGGTVAVPGGMPGATTGDMSGLTVPQQSKAMQDRARDNTVRALEQGAERTRQRADQN